MRSKLFADILPENNIGKTKELFRKILKDSLTPISKITVSEWAAKNRVLSPEDSAEPGKWNNERAPYQVAIMDSFTQVGIRKIVMMLAAQTGKSTMINNCIGRFAEVDPGPIMIMQPTIEMAEDYSKSRISPMIRDTKSLKQLFSTVKSKNTGNTILSKLFPGGRLVMCGANSPAGLASRPIRLLLCDETDRFPESAGTEGDPIDLASKRTSTYWNALKILSSTPLHATNSRIYAEYCTGTQEEWQHKCPKCGEYSLLKWQDMEVDYDESIGTNGRRIVFIKTVKWHCPHCGFGFSEQDMKEQPQKFVPQTPEALKNGVRSFLVNGFASPWTSWKTIVQEYLEAKGDPEREKIVVNTRFAEPYQDKGHFESEKEFLDRLENYEAEVPRQVLMLTAAVDTQDNRLEYEIKGWGRGEECWGIYKGIILGVPDTKEVWETLDEILDRSYQHAGGHKMHISRTMIDSQGHYASEVYKYCAKNKHKQRIAIKGHNVAGVPLIYKLGHAKDYANLPLLLLGVDAGKTYIMDRLSIETPGEKYMHFPATPTGEHPRGYDKIYFKGLIAEKQVPTIKNGKVVMVWKNIADDHRNEPLDLSVYNLANFHSMANIDWDKLDAIYNGTLKTETTPQPKQHKQTYGSATQIIT